jgi:propionate CoA-transferase
MAEMVSKTGSTHPMLSPVQAMRMKKGKIISAEEAVVLIRDGDTIATEGFVGTGFPEEIVIQLKEHFLKTGGPRNLTLIYAAAQGDGKTKGLNHLGIEGLIGTVIGGHIGLEPEIQKLIRANTIFAYNFPQGVLSHLFRDIAGHKPGHLTYVGLGTFVDPRIDGGKLNELTKTKGADLIRLIDLDGKECLVYKTMPIDVAILRGTTADADGNITMEKEALTLEALSMAMAARNSGGIVMVQVERIADRGTLNAREVKIPGILVDCVVVAKPKNHWQTFVEPYDPAFSCEIRMPMQSIPPMEMGPRKVIARRAAFELMPNSVVNLGLGMPEGVAQVANEERIIEYLTLNTEAGVIGGLPNSGTNFGTGINMVALVDQPYQFDFYDGGGLDMAFLGAAEVDGEGNVNVSKFGPRFVGPGGFINISQNSKKIIFVGTFTAGGLKVAVEDGKVRIEQEGKERKFINQVEQKTFSGRYAAMNKQPVLYVTERCVFRLREEGVELIEVAPGIDMERDVLALMDFKPIIKKDPQLMDPRIFQPQPMGLDNDLLSLPIEERLTYHPEEDLFFVNFENLYIKSSEEIRKIRAIIESMLAPLGKKVNTIVNYDNFNIAPDLIDEYWDMVKYVTQFYKSATRYTTSTFLRMKLGDELAKRDVVPHMYETKERALRALLQKKK